MERILNNDEKIKRAEEIYARRRGIQNIYEEEENRPGGIYKILFKLLLLINIIIIVICIQNYNEIFKQEFLEKFSNYTNTINEKIAEFVKKIKENNQVIEEKDENSEKVENTEKILTNSEEVVENKEANLEQEIKSNYKFIKPIEGTITSFFGDRTSIYQNVTGFHKGIDIGAAGGTIIKASMEGIVTQVSSQGDYRKSFENRKR